MKMRALFVTAICTFPFAAAASAQTGACCLTNPAGEPVCVVASADLCDTLGGTYQGDDTACGDTTCPPAPTGACCLTRGRSNICVELTEVACDRAGGTYQGDDTACETADCTPSTTDCPCDLDMDGDSDNMDLLAFLDTWFSDDGDFDDDGDTDVHDLMAFIQCFAHRCEA